MSKLLLLLSFLSLVILAVGTAFMHNSTLFWLASGSPAYQYVREVLATVLFVQLVTHPPRHMVFRILAGVVAVSIGSWALFTTYNGTMPFLDTMSLLASASAIGVTALEAKPVSNKRMNVKQAKAGSGNPLIA
jgi:hypothetical protein